MCTLERALLCRDVAGCGWMGRRALPQPDLEPQGRALAPLHRYGRNAGTAPCFRFAWLEPGLRSTPQTRAFRRAGIYGQTIHIDQASRVVVVKFSTHPEPAGELFGDMFTAITALAQGIGGAKL